LRSDSATERLERAERIDGDWFSIDERLQRIRKYYKEIELF
jgi:hypothetical protein